MHYSSYYQPDSHIEVLRKSTQIKITALIILNDDSHNDTDHSNGESKPMFVTSPNIRMKRHHKLQYFSGGHEDGTCGDDGTGNDDDDTSPSSSAPNSGDKGSIGEGDSIVDNNVGEDTSGTTVACDNDGGDDAGDEKARIYG